MIKACLNIMNYEESKSKELKLNIELLYCLCIKKTGQNIQNNF